MASELFRPASLEVRIRALAHAVGIIVGAYVTAIVLANGAALAVVLAGFELSVESTRFYLLSSVAQFVGFILAVAGYMWYREDWSLFRWGRPGLRGIGLILLGVVALYLLNVAAGVFALVFDLETATNVVVNRGQENPVLFLYMIPITLLLVAPAEELVFRGVVQGWFRRAYGAVPAVLLASVIFGAVHIPALLGEGGFLLYISVAALLGIVLGTLYEYTENIVVPIVVHGLYNTVLFLGQYLLASGYITAPS